jgi:nucleoside-triphosphatase
MTTAEQNHGPLIIVSGPAHCGKTSLVAALLPRLAQQGRRVAGILAEGHWRDNRRSGFTLIDLCSGRRTPLAGLMVDAGPQDFPYELNPKGLTAGRRALSSEDCFDADLVVVDEIGSLEVNGGGWAECLPVLLKRSGLAHLWVVQSRWLESVCAKWGLSPCAIIDAADSRALDRLTAMTDVLLSRSARLGRTNKGQPFRRESY